MSLFDVSYILLWVLLLVMGVLVLLLYRHFGLVSMGTLEGVQRDGVPVGEPVPELVAMTSAGQRITWRPAPAPTLLLFASAECEPCAAVMPHVRSLAMTVPPETLQVVAVTEGPEQSALRIQEKFELPFTCLAEGANGTFSAYRVRVTPFGFVIGEDGRVRAKGLCNSAARLRDLLDTAGMSELAGLVMVAESFDANVHEDGQEASIGSLDGERRGVAT